VRTDVLESLEAERTNGVCNGEKRRNKHRRREEGQKGCAVACLASEFKPWTGGTREGGPRDSAERWDLSEINYLPAGPRAREGTSRFGGPARRVFTNSEVRGRRGPGPVWGGSILCGTTLPLHDAQVVVLGWAAPVLRAAIATGDVTIVFCTPGPHNRLTAVPPHHTASTARKLRRYLAAGDCRKRGGGGLAGKRDGG
jgi:hypothetical protein